MREKKTFCYFNEISIKDQNVLIETLFLLDFVYSSLNFLTINFTNSHVFSVVERVFIGLWEGFI